MTAYYNEIDPFAAQWLRNLIQEGHIAPGDVDERDIRDVRPSDLFGYTQCHFFAGLGGWSYALRQAGWADSDPVWTGSCPCQPFSAAGRGAGFADERHLWPAFHHLIRECRPVVVFGEQVSSPDGLTWFDLVQSDLENTGYAAAAIDSCAAGVGAPHIRQRLYWVADATSLRPAGVSGRQSALGDDRGGAAGRLGDPAEPRSQGVEDGRGDVLGSGGEAVERAGGQPPRRLGGSGRPGPTNGFWRDPDWLFCRDGKWRPVEPSYVKMVDGLPRGVGRLRADLNQEEQKEVSKDEVEAVWSSLSEEEKNRIGLGFNASRWVRVVASPLTHQATGRMGRLRAYGNALVAPQAIAFVRAYVG